MSDLVQVCESLWFHNVRTYFQSGNVAFDHDGRDGSEIAKRLEKRLVEQLGLQVTVFIVTPDDLARIVAGQPFKNRVRARLHVTFLYSTPQKKGGGD